MRSKRMILKKLKQFLILIIRRIFWRPSLIILPRDVIKEHLECDNIHLSYKKYRSVNRKDVEAFLNFYWIDKSKCSSEFSDPETLLYSEFRSFFHKSAFGICWNDKKYAMNFFIDNNLEFWMVNPKNSNIFKSKIDREIDFVLI